MKIINRKGFTLLELLVVIVIMGIMIATVLVINNETRKTQNLNLSAQEVKFALIEALNMSLAPKVANIKGYGVQVLNNTDYVIFEDANNNGKYNNHEGISGKNYSLRTGSEFATNNITVYFGTAQDDPGAPTFPEDTDLPYFKPTKFFCTPACTGNPDVNGEGIITLSSDGNNKNIFVNTYTNLIGVR